MPCLGRWDGMGLFEMDGLNFVSQFLECEVRAVTECRLIWRWVGRRVGRVVDREARLLQCIRVECMRVLSLSASIERGRENRYAMTEVAPYSRVADVDPVSFIIDR